MPNPEKNDKISWDFASNSMASNEKKDKIK